MTNTYNPPINIIFTIKEIKTITKVFVPYPLTLNQQVQFNYSFDLLHKHFRSFTVLVINQMIIEATKSKTKLFSLLLLPSLRGSTKHKIFKFTNLRHKISSFHKLESIQLLFDKTHATQVVCHIQKFQLRP